MNKNQEPLVSICTSFFNSGRYIHRFLISSLNQTYKNIEVVMVDNGSSDDGEKIVMEYASRDSRIKYFRNVKSVGIAESFRRMFEEAQGQYVIFLGVDDWLARDYIENGVKSLIKHPDAAGIVPKIMTLVEVNHNEFKFHDEASLPSGVYSREWFIQHMYKGVGKMSLCITALALVRREDTLHLMDYIQKNYRENPSIPKELRELYSNAYDFDTVFFLEILRRHKSFIWDNSLVYIKIMHSENLDFGLRLNSMSEIFKSYYYKLLSYSHIYKFEWPKFYRGMKIYMGLEALSTAFIYFFRYSRRLSFLNISESKNLIYNFFSNFSIFEIIAVIALSIPRIIYRSFNGTIRRLKNQNKHKDDMSWIFAQKYFLDSEGRFTA